MANKHKDNTAYEEKWQQAFEHAETAPSSDVWKHIDAQLTKQESGKYKRGFFFYRAVAAACLLCLLGLGVYLINDHVLQQQSNALTATQEQEKDNAPIKETPEAEMPALTLEDQKAKSTQTDPALSGRPATTTADTQQESKSTNTHNPRPLGDRLHSGRSLAKNEDANQQQSQEGFPLGGQSRQAGRLAVMPAFISPRGLADDALRKGTEWWKDIDRLYRVPDVYAARAQRQEKQKPTFFAGLNVSGNYFDPNFNVQPTSGALATTDFNPSRTFYSLGAADAENSLLSQPGASPQNAGVNNAPQVSFSYGADVGLHVSKHLSLESGIDYGRYNTNTKTNWAVESLESDKRYPLVATNSSKAAYNNISYTSSTELTNSFELLSLPVKLGYNFLFEKINLFISSGMAANFFIKNSITDGSGQFAQVNVPAGRESPYKNVFYSGVVSGGVNFNVTGGYFLTLSPEYNFSISQMTKEGSFIVSQPYSFGIDVGIRYHFK